VREAGIAIEEGECEWKKGIVEDVFYCKMLFLRRKVRERRQKNFDFCFALFFHALIVSSCLSYKVILR
jgi:hypothetical protein